MPKFHFHSAAFRSCVCGAAGLSLLAARAQAQLGYQYDSDWTRNFRIGAMVGVNIKADFSLKGKLNLGGNKPGVYADGYVHPDAGGALTSDWGYENASQYSAANQTLTMHSASSFTPAGNSSSSGNDSPYIGFDLGYGASLWRWNSLRIGWEVGAGLLPINITDNKTLLANVNSSAYVFDASGIVHMPTAGYQGQPNAPGSPVISSTPASTTTSTINNVQISGTRTLDVMLYTIKLGPTLFWDVSQHVGLQAGIGPALGIVSGNLKYDETINIAGGTVHSVGQAGSTDLTWGGYVTAMVTFHTVKNGDFFLSGEYMPLGTANVGGGGRQAELNLHGQVFLSLGVNWPF